MDLEHWNLALGIAGVLFGGGVLIELYRATKRAGAAEVERADLLRRVAELEDRLDKVPTTVPSLGDVNQSQTAQREAMTSQLNLVATRLHERIDAALATLAKTQHDQGIAGTTIAALREDWYNFTTQITNLIRDEAVTSAAVLDLKERQRSLEVSFSNLSAKVAAIEATSSIKRH
jgi:chromosome segregation ATPase